MSDDEEPKLPVKHFGIDPRKITLAEYWRAPQRGSFLTGLLIKTLPIKIDVARAIPLTESLIEIEPAERLMPTVRALQELGFEVAFYYREDLVQPRGDDAAAALLSPDGRIYAAVLFVSSEIGERTIDDLRSVFVSRVDAAILVTGTAHGEMDSPPEVDGEVVHGTLADAYERHLERIAERTSDDAYRGPPAALPFDSETLRSFVVSFARRFVEFNVARGVFTPMPPEEVTALRRGDPATPAKRRPSAALTVAVWSGVVLLLAIIANCPLM